jgi:hypothetical protein
MGWLMEVSSSDTGRRVGGPLYPPINAFVFAPLGTLSPRVGYRVNQVAGVLLAFVAGLAVAMIARGRVWWPVASTAIILYPGFLGSLNLGQNAALTLAILCWGWMLVDRGRPGWAGVVWGLLAFAGVGGSVLPGAALDRQVADVPDDVADRRARRPRRCPWSVCELVRLAGCRQGGCRYVQHRQELDLPPVATCSASRVAGCSTSRHRRERDRVVAWVIGIASLAFAFTFTAVTAILCRNRARETTGSGPAFVLLGAGCAATTSCTTTCC